MLEVIKSTIMITGFVFTMMLVIEYLNVQTRGKWHKLLKGRKWRQYVLGALLGIIPGCLGSFAMVTLYTHRLVSIGAVVTTMIATSGDEAYVMFALFPGKALLLNVILAIIALPVGVLADLLFRKKHDVITAHDLPIHDEYCECFQRGKILEQLRSITLERFLLILIMAAILLAAASGFIAGEEEGWVRITLIITSIVGLAIVATVPDHFLKEHLWEHVTKRHVPRIFFWTLGALIVIRISTNYLNIERFLQLQQARILVLLIACLVGIIPESGPHLIFVTMFAEGLVPFSILLASSIVQDGHGMLPMLAHSRRDFVRIKAINFGFGLLVGLIGLWLGF
ncbi:MAG TPA: putative manganese transporter [Candidatus Marinimicrobia bacterium]|nr:putative manganese transporter [Candidatus Neomarinimicrobiota bacterium]HRD18486.1 putative manganese transporter [Candidatus Neomarinimicrobiota bacterium]